MSDQIALLSPSERELLEQMAQGMDSEIDGQRARALLAIDDGQSQATAAEMADLTAGQVSYFLRKFREERLEAFGQAAAEVGVVSIEPVVEDQAEALREVIDELNVVIRQLQTMVPDPGQMGLRSMYSPQGILVVIRDNVGRLTPDMQFDMLRNLQGLSAEDLMDIDTWKGMGNMMTYSARFQAGQARDKVSVVINQVMPAPMRPSRLWRFAKRSVDRVTPEFAKQIMGTFQDATVSDLADVDTWKGVWYMISYSIQFQAEQMRDRLIRIEEEQRSA